MVKNKKNIIFALICFTCMIAGIWLDHNFHIVSKAAGIKSKIAHKLSRAGKIAASRTPAQVRKQRDGVLVLDDFEQEESLKMWEGAEGKFRRADKYASEGMFTLEVPCPRDQQADLVVPYNSRGEDWSAYDFLKADIYNPSAETIKLVLIIKDTKGNSYADRFDAEYQIVPGHNVLAVNLNDLSRNRGQGRLDTQKIMQYVFAMVNSGQDAVLYFDHIRLEKEKKGSVQEMIAVTVDPAQTGKKIHPQLFGSNLKVDTTFTVDTIRFAKDIGINIFRFPGGDAPGYHWKTGTFDFKTQKPYMFPFSKYDNFIEYCTRAGTEAVIQVNLESGTPEEAAGWVNYTNKEKDFYVKYWEIGNEPYGDWEVSFRPPEKYARDLKEYSAAMKAVDPDIRIGAACGGDYFGDWDRTVVREAGDVMDFASFHWYPNHTNKGKKYKGASHPDPKDVMANAFFIPRMVRYFNDIVRRENPDRAGKIDIAILEWDGAWDAPSYNPEPYAQGIIQWSLANAIFYAESFAQMIQAGIVAAANHNFQDTPFGLIRGHYTEQEAWNVLWDGKTIRPKALAIRMFSKHFGDVMVAADVENSPTYVKDPDWNPSSYSGEVPYVTAYASKSADEKYLYIMFISRSPFDGYPAEVAIEGGKYKNDAVRWILTGPYISAQNDGVPGTVNITEETARIDDPSNFKLDVPPRSVMSIRLERVED